MRHLRPLDGLRGIAVLAVVLYHFSPDVLPAGFLGVDVFFVLSGFLITSLLVLEFEGSGRIAMWAFWARRARRLLPALLLVVIVVAAYVVFFARPVEAQHISDDGLGTLFYVANWHFIISDQPYIVAFADQAASPLRHMWSLAIEEQFYFVWPLIVMGIGSLVVRSAGRTQRARRMFRYAVLGVSVVGGALSLVWMTTLYEPLDPNRVYYGTDTRIFAMLFGAALGALTAGSLTIARRAVRKMLIVVGCIAAVALLAVMATLTITSPWLYTGGYGVVAVAMVFVLLAAGQPGANPLARVLSWKPLVGLGLISYGVYLWQWPATVWIREDNTGTSGIVLFAIRFAATLAAALVSYWLVEQPIRQRRLPTINLRSLSPAVVPLSCVTVISVILLVPSMTLPTVELLSPIPASKTASAVTAAYAAAVHCDDTDTVDPIVSDRKLRVQFVGNSLAVEAFPCLKRALAARNVTATSVMQVGFPMCDLLPAIKESLRDPATRPDVGLVFSAPAVDTTCDAVGWDEEMQALIKVWKKYGIHTFLVADLPVAGSAKWDHERAINRRLAREDPEHVTALEGGFYLEDDRGVFQGQMPCVTKNEPGCRDGLVFVRSPIDHYHFCAETNWGLEHDECPPTGAGGIRRLVAAIVVSLTDAMQPDPARYLRSEP